MTKRGCLITIGVVGAGMLLLLFVLSNLASSSKSTGYSSWASAEAAMTPIHMEMIAAGLRNFESGFNDAKFRLYDECKKTDGLRKPQSAGDEMDAWKAVNAYCTDAGRPL